MIKINCYLLVFSIGLLFACNGEQSIKESDKSGQLSSIQKNKEPHRPTFHFTPPEKWMNDPNGMVYYAGEYHLFYQYYPDSTVWGPMHWGHAISKDLATWEHLPIALYPCLLYTSPSPRDLSTSRMPSSA